MMCSFFLLLLILQLLSAAGAAVPPVEFVCNQGAAISEIFEEDVVSSDGTPWTLMPPVTPPVKEVRLSQAEAKRHLISLAHGSMVSVDFGNVPLRDDSLFIQSLKRFCQKDFSRPRVLLSSSIPERKVEVTRISLIRIEVKDEALARRSTSEYDLDISNSQVSINVFSFPGLKNALSTLGQFLFSPIPVISLPLHIHDYPSSNQHAGEKLEVIINVAYRFLPQSTLFGILDAMEVAKYDTLRLRLSDHSSLPVMLNSTTDFPLGDLAIYAVDRYVDGSPAVYSSRDLAEIVEYAFVRGIHIIPEFFFPSQVLAANDELSSLLVNCSATNKTYFAMNPNHPKTTVLIQTILRQLTALFPHTEVSFHWQQELDSSCWIASGLILSKQGLNGFISDISYSINKILKMRGKRLVAMVQGGDLNHSSGENPVDYHNGYGIDFTNAHCRLWPFTAMSSPWGNSTLIYRNSSGSFAIARNTRSPNFRLAALHFLFFLKKLGVKVVPPMPLNTPVIRGIDEVKLSYRHAILNESKMLLSVLRQLNHSDPSYVHVYSSHCPRITSSVRRPIPAFNTQYEKNKIRMLSLNMANGGRDRKRLIYQSWRNESNKGTTFIGLCELNGWHDLQEKSRFAGTTKFRPMRKKAALAGFSFSYVTEIPRQRFSVGLVSSIPFQVLAVYGPPLFERACLHVFFEDIETNVFITHLNAHNASQREKETALLSTIVKHIMYNETKSDIIVMGDMNSLLATDSKMHQPWLSLFQEVSTNPLVQHLKEKFCYANLLEINYQSLQNLVDAGLVDSCINFCQISHMAGYSFDTCYAQRCSYTEPTLFNPEVCCICEKYAC